LGALSSHRAKYECVIFAVRSAEFIPRVPSLLKTRGMNSALRFIPEKTD
jgi:hypothetical protein